MPRYEHVVVGDLPDAPAPAAHKKEIDEAVGATQLGCNFYVMRPGETMPWGPHRHPEHEELFYVTAGTVAFDTPDETFTVDAGEAFYVAPDSLQTCRTVGDTDAHVLAMGAPKATDRAEIELDCPGCPFTGHPKWESVDDDGRRVIVLTCPDCGVELDRFGSGPEPQPQ